MPTNPAFTDGDRILYAALTTVGHKYEKVMKESLKFKIEPTKNGKAIVTHKNKSYETDIFFIGKYDEQTHMFEWFLSMKDILLEHLYKHNLKQMFDDEEPLKKLFLDKVNVENFKYIIPYIIAIFNPAFNIVRFESPDGRIKMYALMKLGIKNPNVDEDLSAAVGVYRIGKAILDKKRKTKRGSKSRKSKY